MPETSDQSNRKGRILEDVSQMLYQVSGVEVRKRVWLPPPMGGRKREIDLLITADTPVYPVKFYVECKNEREVVGAGKIDEFVGKLGYLGLPAQYGIYISPTGFTEVALEEARAYGIRTLVLTGLTRDRLEAELLDAVQSHVLYLGFVRQIRCDIPGLPDDVLLSDVQFYDGDGQLVGSPADLLWKAWYVDETIPLVVGDHDIEPPNGYYAVWDGGKYPVKTFMATLGVKAFAFHLPGKAKHLELRDAGDDSLDRQKTEIEFPAAAGYFSVQGFDSEHELNAHLEGIGLYHVAFLVRLPRIQVHQLLWPLSARVVEFLKQQSSVSGGDWAERFGSYRQADIEGDNLATVFEPVRLSFGLWYPEAKVVVSRVEPRRSDELA